MREEPKEQMEVGRIKSGKMGSSRALKCNGAFKVTGPNTRELLVIASDGQFGPEAHGGWEHVSVSVFGRASRTPSWSEMSWVKLCFWKDEERVMQLHPRKSEYINFHPGTLHLWRPVGGGIPVPPKILVGPS